MKIEAYNFKSAITAIVPELIGDAYASDCSNTETTNGAIRPVKGLVDSAEVSVSDLTNSIRRILFRDNASIMASGNNNEHWVESPLAQDDFDRIYWTSANNPPMVSDYAGFGNTDYELGLDIPTGAIGVDATNSSGDQVRITNVLYVEESEWGELSAPGPASELFYLLSDGDFTLTLPDAPVSGHWTHRRIYFSDYSGNYRYHSTIPNTQSTLVVGLPFDDDWLGEELDQIAEDALNTKPRAGMQGLVQMPGGFLSGYEKNVVCFSKAYLPHAWPVNFEITVDGNIQGMAVAASGLVVTTDKKPYLIVGGAPESMAPVQMDMTQPCVAPNAIVDMGSFVVYPSADGLVSIAGESNQNLIDGVIDSDEWRGYVSGDAVACAFNGKYWYFTGDGGFVFDLKNGAYSKHSISAIAVYADDLNDAIFIVTPDGELKKYSRDNAESLAYSWQSKVYEIGGSGGFSCGKIAATGPVNLKVDYINGETVIRSYEALAQPYQAFRLPSVRADKIQYTISGTADVKRVQLATTMQELA